MKAKPSLWRVADSINEDRYHEYTAIDFSDAWTGPDGNLREEIFLEHEFTAVDDRHTVDYMGASSNVECDDYGAQFNES